ncbi:acyl-CoA thioesterase [Leucobacter rhizosphaerae]|uniref:Acyl-CoA thioesterase n=1 Tax=Leucobacter rhizosphaerae TaxID=2932245 RepID=A0ABY4FU85_9MICO|nr:thioesterase family protein [Leucobacter rhizosphaerae]UOQ59821.1 acyl-CoA thioesterase [Leucobacter rhizosphaerae]
MSNGAEVKEYAVGLRWRDLDNQGHVYHGTFLTLLDEARTAFLADLGFENPSAYVLARLEIDYLRELTIDPPAIAARFIVCAVGNSSIELVEEIASRNEICAKSRSVVVLWDATGRKSRALTEQERARVESLRIENEGRS